MIFRVFDFILDRYSNFRLDRYSNFRLERCGGSLGAFLGRYPLPVLKSPKVFETETIGVNLD
jgi:hypothetical protein